MKWNLTKVYDFFGGVTEFYAFVFTATAIYMAFKSLLTATFVAAIGAIQAFVTANDVHNDLNKNGIPDTLEPPVIPAPVVVAPVIVPVVSAPVAPVDPADTDLPGGPH